MGDPGQTHMGRAVDERWIAVDGSLVDLVRHDDALEGALERSRTAGLPNIHVTPPMGKFLHLLSLAIGARNILEVGTLGGYSTIWLARSLPEGGRLITLEIDPAHARVAGTNIAEAGLSDKVEIMVGPAMGSLLSLVDEMGASFDLVFIDADKANTSSYFESALQLTRTGGAIIVDNVVRDGGLADPHSDDPAVLAMQDFVRELSKDDRVEATVVQTVGSKGYDGFALAVVR